jgi:hypothetical protein
MHLSRRLRGDAEDLTFMAEHSEPELRQTVAEVMCNTVAEQRETVGVSWPQTAMNWGQTAHKRLA